MPKLSKRQRMLEKEKTGCRIEAEKKAGRPYSRNKIRTCHHFISYGGGVIVGMAMGLLEPISEKECKCIRCQKRFSMETYHVMEDWTRRYTGRDYIYAQEVLEISGKIPPVDYYYTGPNEITYVDNKA